MSAPRGATVLRVKRKRADDPVDAFVLQSSVAPQTKRRGTFGANAKTGARAHTHAGVFRRAVKNEQLTSDTNQRVIEAEWDALNHRMKLKRKHESQEEAPSVSRTRLDADPMRMDQFAEMLHDYLHRAFV